VALCAQGTVLLCTQQLNIHDLDLCMFTVDTIELDIIYIISSSMVDTDTGSIAANFCW